ncbi:MULTISPECIES: enoyl-CoA hydratase [Mesorhizobium]|uniref:Enoyl-CoA hydratase domain-containing protein 3, mitochondrial n=1 Tax=Mesorhizobium denitrificans TaxID=2294114 RepID=A0A371XDH4_9HYPH|nr:MULTISPECIES: enoyl-CoA hydratase [Mesorhizobium]RFC67287.1 enoyl-CoA hydratase [Mesorhizobium denitrificans]
MAEILAMPRADQQALLRVEQADGVLRLILNRPPANALSIDLIAELQAELDRSAADSSVRVVVIAAQGKVFSGGHDLKEMTAHRNDADKGEAFFEQTFEACGKMMQTIVAHPRPVIAEVNGIATAAGCQLVATCDLAIASDKATFGVNGIDVGLFCTTPGVALARGMKPKHAMEMLFTGEMIDAGTAREFGLVNRVVPAEYLTQVVNKYAQVIVAKSPAAIAIGKRAFYQQAELGLADAYAHASRVMVDNMLGRDAQEGIAAFIEKRKPQWSEE